MSDFLRLARKMFPNVGNPCPDLSGGMSLRDAEIECEIEDLAEMLDTCDPDQCGSSREDYDDDPY